MWIRRYIKLIILIIIQYNIFLLLPVEFCYPQQPIVNLIEIKGVRRIEEGAIKRRITQKTNEPLSPVKISSDIKNIYKLGYFENIRVETEFSDGGIKLIYIVKEKPTIININFHGNREFDEDKLKEKITLSSGSIADKALIQDNIIKIVKFYEEEGYYLAEIIPVLRYIKDDEVSITFKIIEGEKIKIKGVKIIGNNEIPDKRIKKIINTRRWGYFSFLTGSGYVKKDVLENDVELIKDLYHNNGYINVKVSEPKIETVDETVTLTDTKFPDFKDVKHIYKKSKLLISIKVSEGEQYTISSIEVKGFHVFPKEQILKKLTLKKDTVFNKKKLIENIKNLTEFYSQNGYALVSITPSPIPNNNAKTVKIVLNIAEGNIFRIGRIEIMGNTATRDKVVRREVTMNEGDIFDSSAFRRSYLNINNLNYFETVELVPKPQPEKNIVDIKVRVNEKPTGFLSLGGGYSSIDRFILFAQVTKANLFGRGQHVKVSVELGGRSSTYEITFREPWLFDRPVSLSTSIYNTEREFTNYKKRAIGGAIGLGRRFAKYWSIGSTYRYERANVFDIEEDASNFIKEQEGYSTTSSITPTISRDTRDNFIDPSRGSRNSLSVTYAGLGGTNAFIKTKANSIWYFPIGPTTISFRGRYGYADGIRGKELPVFERFYVGGIYTVRGFNYAEAGPRDEEGNLIGGTKQLIFNAEFLFPVYPEAKLKGVIFYDLGSSYDEDVSFEKLRSSAGAGIRWMSPMGPLRFEYGYKLDRKEGESEGEFEFAFGGFFF